MLGDFLPHFGRYSPHSAFSEVLHTIASPVGNVLTIVLAIAGALSFPYADEESSGSRRYGHRLLGLSLLVLFLRSYCKEELLTGVTSFPEFVSTAWDISLAITFGVGILGVPLFFCGVWASSALPRTFVRRSGQVVHLISEYFVSLHSSEVSGILIVFGFMMFMWQPFVACLLVFLIGVGISEAKRNANAEFAVLESSLSLGVVLGPLLVTIALGLVWADTRVLL